MGPCHRPDDDRMLGRLLQQSIRCRNLSDLIQWTASDPRHLRFCLRLIHRSSTGRDQQLMDRIDTVCEARKVNLDHLILRFAEVGRVLGLKKQCGDDPATGAKAILGLPPDASEKQIKKAFRLKAKSFHPDAGSSTSDSHAFGRLYCAYEEALRHVRQTDSSETRGRSSSASAPQRQPNAHQEPPHNISWWAFNWLLIVLGALGCIAFLTDALFRSPWLP